ncbi:NAD(+) diphosphatase [Stappia indica]|uniref:NAD(+) diphosphatase n=1 Tax=Stappia indica TaxID=538381 RepID=UPI001CD812F6|nr:NAD(+) diphosphatase [Stappia indica]MCA1299915.1 NAD(+) diphosphatase [Stappia indica]
MTLCSATLPAAGFAFHGNPLERLSEHRGDAEWLARHFSAEAARFVLFCDKRPVVDVSDQGPGRPLSVLHRRDRADRLSMRVEDSLLLGFAPEGGAPEKGAPVFAAPLEIDADQLEALGEPLKPIDLRSLALQGVLEPGMLGMLAQASALLHWHDTHRFCSRCGSPSVMTLGGYRRDCPACGSLHFPRTDPVAIMLVSDGERCLMGRTPQIAEGVYSTLAGFIEPGETVEEAVRREVFEEAGIHVGAVSYRASQPWPFPASLMMGCHGTATSREIRMDESELEDCRWFSRKEVRAMMASDHPQGLMVPPPLSIAHWLIRSWIEAA